MWPVPYYTAVVARREGDWQLVPADLEDLEDAADLADAVRRATAGEGGLAIVEHEDDWFALVRVDGEEDPRLFVSDVDAALDGPYAGLAEDLDDGSPVGGDAEEEPADVDDEDTAGIAEGVPGDEASLTPAWGGEASLLEDHGLSAEDLTSIVEHSPDPGAAVVEIAKRLGFDDLVDAWH